MAFNMVRPVCLLVLSSEAALTVVMSASRKFEQPINDEPPYNAKAREIGGQGSPIQESPNKAGQNRIRQLGQTSIVAFFATKSKSSWQLGYYIPIVFENTITNVGQGYKNSTGFFTAPVSGVYVFSATILTRNKTAKFHITVNNQSYSSLYAYHTERYQTLSQTTIFPINKGDEVAIHSAYSNRFVYGASYSMFSGFLLS